jgi:large subunit ribosomal protein L17
MLTSFFHYEKIRTTKAKALVVRRAAEKMITRARVDSVHNRRMIGRDIKDQAVLAKLFTDIGPRYTERPGGYTRILKLGPRKSDAAEMVILELVSEEMPRKTGVKKTGKSSEGKSSENTVSKKEKAVKTEAPVEEPESLRKRNETDQKIYQMALRYNDIVVARVKLFELTFVGQQVVIH